MRLALATCARSPCTATEPEAVRCGAWRRGGRPGQRDRDALEQEARRVQREDAHLAVPVLQADPLLVARDDRAAEAGAGLLDHQAGSAGTTSTTRRGGRAVTSEGSYWRLRIPRR
jgi:hypothetical protein